MRDDSVPFAFIVVCVFIAALAIALRACAQQPCPCNHAPAEAPKEDR